MNNHSQTNRKILLGSFLLITLYGSALFVFATPPTTPYRVSEAITDPACIPGGTNCFVAILESQDEGTNLTYQTDKLNFVGSGVTATEASGTVTVTIPGATVGQPVVSATANRILYTDASGNLANSNDLEFTSSSFEAQRTVTAGYTSRFALEDFVLTGIDVLDPGASFPGAVLEHRNTGGDQAYVGVITSGGPIFSGGYVSVDGTVRSIISGHASGFNIGFVNPSVDFSIDLDSSGVTFVNNNASSYTFPTTDGTSGQFLRTNGSGALSWATVSSSISGLIAATANNTIDNGNYAQEWQWNTLSSNTGLTLSSNSTTASTSTQKLLAVTMSGANANSGETTYAASFVNTHTGTSSTNIAGYFSASGGTNNYGLVVASGNTGIGTTTPSYRLDVSNTASGTVYPFNVSMQGSQYIRFGSSSSTNKFILFDGGSFIRPQSNSVSTFKWQMVPQGSQTISRVELNNASDQIRAWLEGFATGGWLGLNNNSGTEVVRLITNQDSYFNTGFNMGFGTASPIASTRVSVLGSGTSSSTYGLQVHNSTGTNNGLVVRDDGWVGFGTASDLGYSTKFNVVSSATSGAIMTIKNTDASGISAAYYMQNDGTLRGTIGYGNVSMASPLNNVMFYQGLNVDHRWINNNSGTNTVNMSLTSGGNLGVGLGTTSATARVQIAGSGTSSSTYGLQVHNSTGTNNGLVVRDDGNVGIGTASPATLLQIGSAANASLYLNPAATVFNARFDQNGATDIALENRTSGTNAESRFYFRNTSTDFASIHSTSAGYTNTHTGSDPYSMVFYNKVVANASPKMKFAVSNNTAASQNEFQWISAVQTVGGLTSAGFGTTTPIMTLKGSGNLLIGTTTNSARLMIAGSGTSSSTYGLQVHNSTGTNNALVVRDDGFVGIGMSGPSVALDVTGDIEYTGTITDVSDERLKANITDFESGLSIINSIGVKNYNMINTPERQETGFIAQNVNSIFPQAVSIVDPANGYMGVSYVSFIPVLTKAIQELDLKITDLQSLDLTKPFSIASLIKSFLENVNNMIDTIFARKVDTQEIQTDRLCVGSICVTEEQFIEVFNSNSSNNNSSQNNEEIIPEEIITTEEPNEEIPIEEISIEEIPEETVVEDTIIVPEESIIPTENTPEIIE